MNQLFAEVAAQMAPIIASFVVTVAAAVIAAAYQRVTGKTMEEKDRLALHSAFSTAAAAVVNRFGPADSINFDWDQAREEMKDYVIESVPDVIAKLKPTARVYEDLATRYIMERIK